MPAIVYIAGGVASQPPILLLLDNPLLGGIVMEVPREVKDHRVPVVWFGLILVVAICKLLTRHAHLNGLDGGVSLPKVVPAESFQMLYSF